uniref:Uncharacterized protein n=1 Tax=Paramoeba aestuarina TaxID=180227 RepID=A0A7S4PC09_9EUKA
MGRGRNGDRAFEELNAKRQAERQGFSKKVPGLFDKALSSPRMSYKGVDDGNSIISKFPSQDSCTCFYITTGERQQWNFRIDGDAPLFLGLMQQSMANPNTKMLHLKYPDEVIGVKNSGGGGLGSEKVAPTRMLCQSEIEVTVSLPERTMTINLIRDWDDSLVELNFDIPSHWGNKVVFGITGQNHLIYSVYSGRTIKGAR